MKIVVLDGFALNPGDLSWDELAKVGDLKVYDHTPPELTFERAKDADVVFTNKTIINNELVSKLDKLKYIGILATGYNVVDIKACNDKNITVTNVPAYSTASVAQFVFALILEFCHRVQYHSDSVFRGDWSRNRDFCYWLTPQVELANKTLGIIGFGSIGQRVGQIAESIGMNVIALKSSQESLKVDVKRVELDELLQTSDFVSLHCPLTEQNKGMVNKTFLSRMKKSAILINTGRGPLVMDSDLADALNSSIIAGAALDVLTTEPPSADNPLLKAKNCIITPHIAWASIEARQRLMNIAVNNLKGFLYSDEDKMISFNQIFI